MTYKEYYKFPEGANIGFKYPISLLDTLKPDELCPSNLSYIYANTARTVFRLPNTSLVTTINNMFASNSSLLVAPYFDTSNVTAMNSMFYYCQNLTTVPHYDTSKVTNMNYMFSNCSKLTSVPHFDTSNVTNMSNMFYSCSLLKTIPPFNTSKVTTMDGMLSNCYALESLPALDCGAITYNNYYPLISYGNNFDKLTDVGGFLNMKFSWENTYGLPKCPNLSRESCINILNGLYDFTGNGVTPAYNQGKLKVHANFLSAVGDQISIATNKGWVVTA